MGRRRDKVICHKDFSPLSPKIGSEFSREHWGLLRKSISREFWRRHLFFCLSSTTSSPSPQPRPCPAPALPCPALPLVPLPLVPRPSFKTLVPFPNHVIRWYGLSQAFLPLDAGAGHSPICQSQNSISFTETDV